MKRTIFATLIAVSLSAAVAPAFADGEPNYPANTTSSQASGLSRSDVKAQLAAAERDGSTATLDATVYHGR